MTRTVSKTGLALAAATLALAGGATLAHAQRGAGPAGDMTRAAMADHAGKMFERMDRNRNGTLDAADRAAHEAERFGKLDADGNGEVSKAEMQAGHDAAKARKAERRAAREGKAGDRLEQRFARLDTDGSGGLSQAEMAAARELREQRKGARGDRAEGREQRGAHEGGHRGGRHGKAMMHGLLRDADADGNHAVTRAEFDAAVARQFARIDTDGNGTASAAERKAAREAMRAQRKAG